MMKVFWGVLLALLAFSAITAVLSVLGMVTFASAVHEVVEQDAKQTRAAMVAQHQAEVRQQQEAAWARAQEMKRRELATDERCVGGTVIRVSGSSYTQVLGGDLRPVACSGAYRLH